MHKKLILVDFENVSRINLSQLDESYSAIVFLGARQEPPKAARLPATAHRFRRVTFHKVDGTGPNALDFYIAFHLGRTVESAPQTECFVLSRDKGFDPLLVHVNRSGVKCRRIEAIEELISVADVVACQRCGKADTIEHHGGLWCSNCGRFATPPDPALLPSNQPGYREEHLRQASTVPSSVSDLSRSSGAWCAWCDSPMSPGDGIYDDGEWMCGGCVSYYAA